MLLKFIFIFLIYLNIRQKKRLSEQETKHLNTLLEQRNQLFSQIAHDLSNPVTVASLHIEAMQHQIVECIPENLNKVSGQDNEHNMLFLRP